MFIYAHAEERRRQPPNELQQADQFRALVRELRQAQRRRDRCDMADIPCDVARREAHILAAAVDRELGLLESE